MKSLVTRVFLVRHGATVLSAEDRFAGATNVELSDEGRKQTHRLAERLSHEKIVALYASPLGRARNDANEPYANGRFNLTVYTCIPL